MTAFLTFLLIALVGVGVGVLSGLLGIGGGMIMVPLFRLCFGMEPLQATGTSLLAIVPTSVAGLVQRVRQHDALVVLGLATGVAGAFSSPVGVTLASMSPGWLVMLVAAAVIAYSAVTTLRKAVRAPKGARSAKGAKAKGTSSSAAAAASSARSDSGRSGAGSAAVPAGRAATAATATAAAPSAEPLAPSPSKARQAGVGVGIGLLAGLLSGYVGVGGGFVMVPMFCALAHASMRQSTATSLISISILSVPGALLQVSLGNAQAMVALAVAVGSIPGAVWGARLAHRVDERRTRLAFGAMLLVAAVMLVVEQAV